MFGTLQKRLPQELRVAGITTMEAANHFLENVYLPRHNAAFARTPEDAGSAFVPFAGLLADILCVQEERVVGNDNTVRYKNRACRSPPTATVTTTSRCAFASTRMTRLPSSTARGVWRAIRPQARSWTNPINRQRETLRCCRPVDLWTTPPRCPQPHRPHNHNRSGQFIWYLTRTARIVIDTSAEGSEGEHSWSRLKRGVCRIPERPRRPRGAPSVDSIQANP